MERKSSRVTQKDCIEFAADKYLQLAKYNNFGINVASFNVDITGSTTQISIYKNKYSSTKLETSAKLERVFFLETGGKNKKCYEQLNNYLMRRNIFNKYFVLYRLNFSFKGVRKVEIYQLKDLYVAINTCLRVAGDNLFNVSYEPSTGKLFFHILSQIIVFNSKKYLKELLKDSKIKNIFFKTLFKNYKDKDDVLEDFLSKYHIRLLKSDILLYKIENL